MDDARPLRDVFADLVGDESARRAQAADPEGFLETHGHGGLSESLVAEAIVNYADTAPAEVAEHLAPFVMAHSPVPFGDEDVEDLNAASGLDLLATAPAGLDLGELPAEPGAGDELAAAVAGDLDAGHAADHSVDLDFGLGDAGVAAEPGTEPETEPELAAGLDEEGERAGEVPAGDEATNGARSPEDDLGSADWFVDADEDLLAEDGTEDSGPEAE